MKNKKFLILFALICFATFSFVGCYDPFEEIPVNQDENVEEFQNATLIQEYERSVDIETEMNSGSNYYFKIIPKYTQNFRMTFDDNLTSCPSFEIQVYDSTATNIFSVLSTDFVLESGMKIFEKNRSMVAESAYYLSFCCSQSGTLCWSVSGFSAE